MNDVTERKRRIREFVAKRGGPKAVAKAAGMTPSYVSQLMGERYPAGDPAVRNFEAKLGLPALFFDSDEGVDMTTARPLTELGTTRVFVESWEAVGTRPSASASLGTAVVPLEVGPRSFVLRMPNDSMLDPAARPGEPSILPGMLICADPDQPVKDGDIAIVRLPGARTAVCRQVVEDMGFRYLRALNRQFTDMPKLPDEAIIVGRVVGGVSSWN
jgi:hypothetical protein